MSLYLRTICYTGNCAKYVILLIDSFGVCVGGKGVNKAWKETDEEEKNSPPIKTCLKDNIVPFPGIKICWGPRQWAFYSNIISS